MLSFDRRFLPLDTKSIVQVLCYQDEETRWGAVAYCDNISDLTHRWDLVRVEESKEA